MLICSFRKPPDVLRKLAGECAAYFRKGRWFTLEGARMELVGVGQTCGPQKKMMVNNGENRMSYLPFWSILGMVYIPSIQMANLGMIVCYWVYHININVESKLILTNDTGVLWLTIKPILDRWVTPLWSSTFCTSPSLWLGCRSWDPWDSDWWLSSVFKSVLKKKTVITDGGRSCPTKTFVH
jgi:hypothetical protein